MHRRTFLQAAGAAAATSLAYAETVSPFIAEEWTVGDIQDKLQRGHITSESLTRDYLERIDALNLRGPELHAVLEINPDAVDVARALDRERHAKGSRSPLHGVPVLIKDNTDTADRLHTTAGSLALLDAPTPQQDAPLVARLRQAGAVLLGKTNLSEWSNFRGQHSTSGWSGRAGLTRNPYALDRNPCGSSSGSAVAVAANLCAIAVGTETDGSITGPASMNGIVGIKPTVGAISQSGIIPISSSQDTAGPMTRTVRDAAILLGVLSGRDYTSACRSGQLRGARLGVARQFIDGPAPVDRATNEVLALLQREGATLVDPVEFPELGNIGASELILMEYEFKAGLNRYLSQRGGRVRTLADCIAFNEEHRQQEMPYFGQELMQSSEERGPLTDPAYQKAVAHCARMRKHGIDHLMKLHRLDAIIAPTIGPAPLTDLVNGDPAATQTTSPAAIAGYPHITVPAAFISGLPVGFSFFGSAWSEEKLIALAYSFEQASRVRRVPKFLSTAALG